METKTLRDFSKNEIDLMLHGKCPACGKEHTGCDLGPRGGLMRNVVMECGARMNIPDPKEMGWPPTIPIGQMFK